MQKEKTALTPQKAMRRSYSRVGWATLAIILFSSAVSGLLVILQSVPALTEPLTLLLNDYFLYFNEALVAAAILVGLLVLIGTRGEAPVRTRQPFRFYFGIFAVCVAVSTIGNVIGNLWTLPLNSVLGGVATDDLAALLDGQKPFALILCVGILAPVFEEFFFRKLLIDRLHAHGEFLAVLTSGLLFGLFHQNVGQYFYTFGVGILLAYLYLRTGSYLAAVLMHAAFNLLLGVLPTLVMGKTEEFLLLLEEGFGGNFIEQLPALLAEFALPLALLGFQRLLVGLLTPAGIVFFILSLKRVRIAPAPDTLSVWDMGTNAYINAGMLACCAVLLTATAISPFLM